MKNVKPKHNKMILPVFVLAILIFIFPFSISRAFTVGVPANFLSLNSGLIGYWTFDGKDVVNGVVRDKSGNGNHGNPINIATSTFYAQGKMGQGFNFDGVNDYVNTSDIAFNFERTSPFSISLWYKNNGSQVATPTFFGSMGGPSFRGYLLGIQAGGTCSSNKIGFFFANSHPTNYLSVCTPSNTNFFTGWHHVVMTYDGTSAASGVKIYIDNVSQTLTTISDTLSGTTVNSGVKIRIGDDQTSDYYKGTIDEVRIYNRTISAQEVQQLYKIGASSKLSSSPTASSSPLTNGLVGYWTFDGKDISNGLILDKSGNGNNATSTNIATSTFYTQGKIGQGLKFDGVNDLVTAGPFSSIDAVSTFTISQWVKTSQNSQVIFAAKLNSVPTGWDFQTEGTTKQVTFVFYNPTSKGNTPAIIEPGVWYHISAVFDGTQTGNSNRLKIYVNGVNQTLTFTGTIPSAFSSTIAQLTFGGWSGANSWYSGTMDETRIYNRALSEQEINQLYKMGSANKIASSPTASSSPLTNGLVGYWTFDGKDVVNGVARDTSGNGNNGNLLNIATSSFYAQGKMGQGFNFDGIDDYFGANTFSSVNPAGNYSISLWFKARQVSDPVQKSLLNIRNSISDRAAFWIVSNELFTVYYNGSYTMYSTPVTANKWTHAVMVNNSGVISLYINGVNVSNTGTTAGSAGNITGTFIGMANNTGNNPFPGVIDDVRIYNRVLSTQEVQQLYNMSR